MKILYNEIDITKSVKVNRCVHEMYAEDRCDSISIKLTDNEGIWDKWSPSCSDELSISDGIISSGKMYVSSIRQMSGELILKAHSIPLIKEFKESNAWEQISFNQIVNDIATAFNLNVKMFGVNDRVYNFLEQTNESQLELLNRLCKLEGLAFLTYDNNLIIYDQNYLENQHSLKAVTFSKGDRYVYIDNSSNLYGSCLVTSGGFSGLFSISDKRTFNLVDKIKLSSNAEAIKYSKSTLRELNKNGKIGWFQKGMLLDIAPGSVIQINNIHRPSWDGQYFIYKMRNDYVNKISKIFFRKPLEDY